MTYTFKLSARLARIRLPMLLLLAMLTGCAAADNGDPVNPGDTDSTPTLLSISPAAITMDTSETVAFSVTGWTNTGDSVTVDAIWSSSGGSITPAGVFTAQVAGTYDVVARQANGTLLDSAWVFVAAAPPPPPPPPPSLAAVVVSPANTAINTSETATFSAYGRNTAGDSIPVSVSWVATGGSISAAGVFSASAAGSYLVVGSAGAFKDTATVTVSAPPPPPPPSLAAIVVSPGSAAIDTGETAAFFAYGRNTAGDSVPVGVTWVATGGSISAAGVFSASAAGSYLVIGGAGAFKDTATVTVSAAPPPPPPPPPSGLVNECATQGAGWIWCDDFDQDRLASYFEYDPKGGSFVRANGVGNGGSHGMTARFAAGRKDAGSLHMAMGKTPQAYFRPVDAGTANYREIYWRYYIRYQAGWTGGGADKMSRATSFASTTSWAQSMIAHLWSGLPGGNLNSLLIEPASGTDVNGNLQTTTYNDFPNLRWLGSAPSQTRIFDAAHVGSWYCVEAHVRLNDAGQANGVFEMWIDGAAEASRTGLNWLGAFNQYGINAVFLENYWNAGSPVAQERYFDNFVVSTQRVGC